MDLNTDRLCRGGFAYLNSDECIQAWADIYREELETIEYIGSSRLRDIYAQVRDLNERRDIEMLGNIRAYCASAAQTCGAFLVGAAHRKSLLEKLRAAGETAVPHMEWDVGGCKLVPDEASARVPGRRNVGLQQVGRGTRCSKPISW